jgi:hypothetical protein
LRRSGAMVSANRWIKQLRREAARNPGKAGVLGLLLVVALWFWAPLVWGWIGPSKKKDAPSASAGPIPVVSEAATPSPGASSPATASTPAATWQQLVEWRKQDPLTTVADTLKLRRDPFHAVEAEVAQEDMKAVQETVQPVAVLKPEDLGLKVTSTIVGPARRVALINGRTYREGQRIQCGREGQEIAFLLAEVHPWHVILEREGHRFELAIPKKALSDRIELSATPR